MADANKAYASADKMLKDAKELDPEMRQKANRLLAGVKSDLQLVEVGKGDVHNFMYSLDLLDSVAPRCQDVIALIEKSKKKP